MKNLKEFGEFVDTYDGKAKFLEKMKGGEEEGLVVDWVEALLTSHDESDLNLSWNDLEEEQKDKLFKTFEAEKPVWSWMCKNAKDDE